MNETEIKPSAFDSLNTRQKNFVLNYMESRVATTAYLDAYATSKNPIESETAAAASSRLLRNVNIKAAIQEKFNEIWNKKEDRVGAIFDEMAALGFSDINNMLKFTDGNLSIRNFDDIDTRAIKKIKIRRVKEESFTNETSSVETDIIELELHDKKGSLSELADILKLKKQEIDLNLKNPDKLDLSKLTDEELEQFIILKEKMEGKE